MRTVIVEYESGNLHSVKKAFERMAGADDVVCFSDKPDDIAKADRVVLPGDGAFPAARAAMLARAGLDEALDEAIRQKGRPFMGICVGMQLMACVGFENEKTAGLGWIKGEVHPLAPDKPTMKIPHMGWNDLTICHAHPLLEGVESGGHAYFIHSYAMMVENSRDCLATADYGQNVSAIVGRDNMFGTQFHPEKSQHLGLQIIENFLRWRP